MGDRVWHDLNANGVQDAGEAGVGGVTVQLMQGSSMVATTSTDSTGKYLFGNVAAGTYTVTFQKPSGFSFTPVTTQESKVTNVATGATAAFTVATGQTVVTIDAGLFQGACLLALGAPCLIFCHLPSGHSPRMCRGIIRTKEGAVATMHGWWQKGGMVG